MIEHAKSKRLIIFSMVEHHQTTPVRAHSGFVREVDIWARIFAEVAVIAPLDSDPPLSDTIPYSEANIVHIPFGKPLNTRGKIGKVRLALAMPGRVLEAFRVLRANDVVMARGPESVGFMGVVVTRFSRLPRFARYVDQWESFPNEAIQYRIQKAFYRSPSFGGPVMIYGKADAPHLVPFVTSSITRAEWEEAGRLIEGRTFSPPYRLLFVGRFIPFKRVDLAIKAFKQVIDSGVQATLDIVGDGLLNDDLHKLVQDLGIGDQVRFHGWIGWDALKQLYAQAHVLIHSSRKEGFGKVLIEGMTFAVPLVGTDVGVSNFIVNPPETGLLVPPNDESALAQAITQILSDPALAQAMGSAGRVRVQTMLLENVESLYRSFTRDHLGLSVD